MSTAITARTGGSEAVNEELLSIDKVAELFQVDRSTVHRWIHAVRLQACKLAGKAKVVERGELERFMREDVLKRGLNDTSPGELGTPIGTVG